MSAGREALERAFFACCFLRLFQGNMMKSPWQFDRFPQAPLPGKALRKPRCLRQSHKWDSCRISRTSECFGFSCFFLWCTERPESQCEGTCQRRKFCRRQKNLPLHKNIPFQKASSGYGKFHCHSHLHNKTQLLSGRQVLRL